MGQSMHLVRRLIILAIVSLQPLTAAAQSDFSSVVSVNSGSITGYDVEQRMALLTALGAPADQLRDDAIAQLIDDELKTQFGERLGILISDGEVAQGLMEFTSQRNIDSEDYLNRLADYGVHKETMDALLRAGLVWRQIVQGRFRSQALPTDKELDEALNLAAAAARESIRLAEIVLPFSERGQAETFAFAQDLAAKLNGGGDFGEAAKTYSRSSSASVGGTLDWMPKDRLPALISSQALQLSVGGVSGPIPFPQGIVLLKLIGEREESSDRRPDVTVTYGELALAGSLSDIVAETSELETCPDLKRLAAKAGLADGIVGPVNLSDLDASSALRIARLDIGESDLAPTANGASLLFLCERTSATDAEMRDQMRGLLFSRRIAALGDGLLQELKRNAVIKFQ